MRTNLASETLLLLGGAAAGAIAMYLLDPDQGKDRRTQIATRAGQAASEANESIHAKADRINQFAHRLSHQAADHLASTAAHTSDQAHSILGRTMSELANSVQTLVDRAKDYADHAQGHASATRDDLTNRANSLYGRVKTSALRRAGLRESHPYRSTAGHTFGTAGVLAVGAGLMFFFDPARGRSRRAWARDKVLSYTRKANKSASRYGRHVGNKIHGAVAEAKHAVADTAATVSHHSSEPTGKSL
jgi:gas vesicle protein